MEIKYLGVVMTPRFILYLALLLVSVGIGLVNFKKLPAPQKKLTFLIGIVFLSEFSSFLLLRHKIIDSNYVFYYGLQVVQLVLYGQIYAHYFRRQDKFARIIRVGSYILATTVICIGFFHLQQIAFPSITSLLLSLFILANSLMLFLYLMNIDNVTSTAIWKQAQFWINSGNLLFFGITSFVFGFFAYLEMPDWALYLIQVMNYVLYSFYLISMIISVTRRHAN